MSAWQDLRALDWAAVPLHLPRVTTLCLQLVAAIIVPHSDPSGTTKVAGPVAKLARVISSGVAAGQRERLVREHLVALTTGLETALPANVTAHGVDTIAVSHALARHMAWIIWVAHSRARVPARQALLANPQATTLRCTAEVGRRGHVDDVIVAVAPQWQSRHDCTLTGQRAVNLTPHLRRTPDKVLSVADDVHAVLRTRQKDICAIWASHKTDRSSVTGRASHERNDDDVGFLALVVVDRCKPHTLVELPCFHDCILSCVILIIGENLAELALQILSISF
mmetsp:Transcript_9602/g.33756  ORF Transcript_9602/g.33756 Transcript_9602/m.33756 type:complete len:281 (+) Transcript_9602:2124-2966(+)